MIVFCEECGTKNIISPESITDKENFPRCKVCKDKLRVFGQQAVLLQKVIETAEAAETSVLKPKSCLELKFRETVLEVNEVRPNLTMGRQTHNDLEVLDNRVSRSHARIEFRDGKYMLIDQSTNGTYVSLKGKKGINLKRDELLLYGSGIIGLGRKVVPESPEAIHFTVKM